MEEEIRNAIINWLSEDYPMAEAIEQIENANITRKGAVYTITYNNGVVDKVFINSDLTVNHLNPSYK